MYPPFENSTTRIAILIILCISILFPGPSKQYGWIGHGRYAPLNIQNPFPADLPKWIPMGNNIFEAGLLYPGKPGGKPAPPPPSYSAAAPAPPAPPSYSAPAATYSAEPIIPNYESAESVDSYSAPIKPVYAPPQPVYNPQPTSAPIPVPADIPGESQSYFIKVAR